MEGRIGSKAHGPDQEPSGRGATTRSQVERLRTGLPQQSNRLGGLYADDQVLSMYADGHIATEEARDPAERLLLDDSRSTPGKKNRATPRPTLPMKDPARSRSAPAAERTTIRRTPCLSMASRM